ncbi:MAG TPA: hypothetical protein GX707_16285 [Epulopiscium sp.]|nr:hypothetical protein [Candidatus Epulonipiscium sp.]
MKAELDRITEQIKDKNIRYINLDNFLDKVKKQEGLISEFDPLLWNGSG